LYDEAKEIVDNAALDNGDDRIKVFKEYYDGLSDGDLKTAEKLILDAMEQELADATAALSGYKTDMDNKKGVYDGLAATESSQKTAREQKFTNNFGTAKSEFEGAETARKQKNDAFQDAEKALTAKLQEIYAKDKKGEDSAALRGEMKALQQAVDAKRKEFETAERDFNIKKDKYDTMNADKKRQDQEAADAALAEKKKEYDNRRTAYDEKRNEYFTAKNGKEAKQKEIDELTT